MSMQTQPRAAQQAAPQTEATRRETQSTGSNAPASGNGGARKAGLIGGIAAAVIVIGLIGLIAAALGGVSTQDKRDLSYAPAQEALYERHDVWYGALSENVARPFERVAKADASAAVATMGLDLEAAKALLADIESEEVVLGHFAAWDPDGTRGAVVSFSLPSGWSTQIQLKREPQRVYVPLRVGGPPQLMIIRVETPNTSAGLGFSNRQVVTDWHALSAWKMNGPREFKLMVQ